MTLYIVRDSDENYSNPITSLEEAVQKFELYKRVAKDNRRHGCVIELIEFNIKLDEVDKNGKVVMRREILIP